MNHIRGNTCADAMHLQTCLFKQKFVEVTLVSLLGGVFMKRGGIWQRRAAERDNEAASSSGTKRCNLADLLIEEWGFGRMSAPMVQRIAAASHTQMVWVMCRGWLPLDHGVLTPTTLTGTWSRLPSAALWHLVGQM